MERLPLVSLKNYVSTLKTFHYCLRNKLGEKRGGFMIYDLIVLGGGPGGYIAAERAGHAGLKTALVEKRELGGVCLNEGCVPTKTFLNSAKIYDYIKHGGEYGVSAENASLDHKSVVNRKNKVVRQLVSGIKAAMKSNNVNVISGLGYIKGRNADGYEISVGDALYTAKNIIIATGSEAIVPGIPGIKEGISSGNVMTNREILDMQDIPSKLVVIGGGVIGLEMASYFNSAGSNVVVIEMAGKIAGPTDEEISGILMKNYMNKGVAFHLNAKVVKYADGQVVFEKDGKTEAVQADKVLLSVGRKPVTEGIGLENVGVEVLRGRIPTDKTGQTNIPNIYAVGDVNGVYMLAHTAYREAEVAVNNILGKKDTMRYTANPSVIYTNPEVGCVGETELTAEQKGIKYQKSVLPMNYSGRYVAENNRGDGICKILVEEGSKKLLGCHIIGSYAGEIITTAGIMIENEMRFLNPIELRKPGFVEFEKIPVNQYSKTIDQEKINFTTDDFMRIYRDMAIIREFETMLLDIKVQGQYKSVVYNNPGSAHLSLGQEASAVGQAYLLDTEDYIFGSHRSHGEILAKGLSAIYKLSDSEVLEVMESFFDGATLKVVEGKQNDKGNVKELAVDFLLYGALAEIFARETGFNKGLGGSMHAFFTPFGIYPNNAIVGGSATIAMGAALYKKCNKKKGIVISNAYGEDNRDWGGAFAVYRGLTEALPYHRFFNSPISEAAIVGSAVGYAIAGGRVIAELMYCDFLGRAGDEVFNQLSKWQAMSAGVIKMPVVLRISIGSKYGAQHSQDWTGMCAHIPGLKVVFPATPYDAKGLMNTALSGTDPVVFFESQRIYDIGEEFHKEGVPEGYYEIEMGKPDIKREGKDITILTIGATLYRALEAAKILDEKYGVSAEVIDARTIVPFDYEILLDSVRKTGKLLLSSDACERGSFLKDIAANVTDMAFDYLDAPPVVVGARNWITPAHELENMFFPQADCMIDAIHQRIMPLEGHTAENNFTDNEKLRRSRLGEYVFNRLDVPSFMLWRNDNAVIVGKNQNTAQEINADYVRENSINVIRRLSGGGAVYHDLENLNFTFIFPDNGDDMADYFKRFTAPLVGTLELLGVKARLSGRNDVEVDGRKISGNSQYISNGKVLHHGTVLINSNIEKIRGALNPDKQKIQSKAIKSVSSRVANIKEFVDITVLEFKELFEKHIYGSYGDVRRYELTCEDIEAVNKLVSEKYGTWEWNYGYSPKYDYTHSARFPGGGVEININVSGGIITAAHISGDFFSKRDIKDVEDRLNGARHERGNVRAALDRLALGEYFVNIEPEDIIGMF
ncbi:disulfide oxidoreductase [Holotrichia oblita]|nr:disulfide oxidoreductase [Holotrichia oblita]